MVPPLVMWVALEAAQQMDFAATPVTGKATADAATQFPPSATVMK